MCLKMFTVCLHNSYGRTIIKLYCIDQFTTLKYKHTVLYTFLELKTPTSYLSLY